jgi:hypothetical protein
MRQVCYCTILAVLWISGMMCVYVWLAEGAPNLFVVTGDFWPANRRVFIKRCRRSSRVLALEPVRRVAGGRRLASGKAVVVSRASIRMRSRIFAIGSRRTIVAAAGLCMTAFFHRSGGDLRRSCRIRSNHSNARRHDRRAMRNVILVT